MNSKMGVNMNKPILKMNTKRAKELLVPLYDDKARDISKAWTARLIEALERVIELEKENEGLKKEISK